MACRRRLSDRARTTRAGKEGKKRSAFSSKLATRSTWESNTYFGPPFSIMFSGNSERGDEAAICHHILYDIASCEGPVMVKQA